VFIIDHLFMTKNLVIVESPAKAKTIEGFLGKDYLVKSSFGHVRDLSKKELGIDIEHNFMPAYEVSADKIKIVKDLKKLAKEAETVWLASDEDREGEAISWHLVESLGLDMAKVKRIVFHEITKEAVLEALTHPREIDQHLREAQEARRVLDRIVGYDLSGLIWKKVRYGLSAGRVQSPALRIIMEREREIRAFIPETYWTIEGQWKTKDAASLALICSKEPRDKKEVDNILAVARKEKWLVKDIEESEQKRSPKAPFITSTLQQAASSRLGYSPSRTMGIAQKLYESGYITYMRTDSTNLGQQALDQIGKVVKKKYGEQYLLFRKYAAKSKNAQEAHEAIRPSHFDKENSGNNDEQKRLYRLIWQRAVSSQMTDARMARTKIIANIESTSDTITDFEANGSRILFDGWLKADPESTGEETTLPKCAKGEKLDLIAIDSTEKQTLPPPRYTEAGLIKELEKRGIGRPSTYASICKTIEDRGYVAKENKALKPTDTGDVVSSFLEEYFPTYISDSFTAEMEDELDEIANGTRTYLKTLTDFYKPFHKEVLSKDKLAKATNLGIADAKFVCPKCGATPMDIKLGRNGKFLSCSRYPDCDGALTLDGTEFKSDTPIGNDPTTGLPIYVLNGRFGPYVQLGQKPPKVKKVKKVKTPKIPKIKGAKKTKKGAPDLPTDTSGVAGGVTTTMITNGAKSESATPTSPIEQTAPIIPKPKMASIPKYMNPSLVTVADALKFLSLPRTLGIDPKTSKDVIASAGRFGPYIVSDGNYRTIKGTDNVYDITLERALEMLAVPKLARGKRQSKK